MKTLYLHIGTPKTGTSSIQTFLRKNKEQLAGYNYSYPLFSFKYPDIPRQRNGYFLTLGKKFLANSETGEPNAEWKEHYAAALERIHQEFEHCDNLILSEETLWHTICDDPKGFLRTLPEDAKENHYQIKIIVYLRRQDLFLTSLWNQKVKVGKTGQSLSDYLYSLQEERPFYADYNATLHLVADLIGKENMIVRRFEPSFWVNHSICADFLAAIGLNHSLPFDYQEDTVNLSLKGNAVEIQRLINSMNDLSTREKRDFSQYTRAFSVSPENTAPTPHLSTKKTADLLARYQEGNNRVAKEFFNDGFPLFSDEIMVQPDWKPDYEALLSDTMHYFLTIVQDLNQQNSELSREISDLKQEKKTVRHSLYDLKKKIGSKILKK